MKKEHKYGIIALAAAAVLLAADRITKRLILLYLDPAVPAPVIRGFLEFSYVENTGVAFGMFKGFLWPLAIITFLAVIVVGVVLFRYRNHTFFSYTTAALIIAGGLGNLVDRLLFGYVVDFIHVLFFPYIFNFADCCVTVGAVCLIVHVILLTRKEGKAASGEGAE